jgi:hypothetical protein
MQTPESLVWRTNWPKSTGANALSQEPRKQSSNNRRQDWRRYHHCGPDVLGPLVLLAEPFAGVSLFLLTEIRVAHHQAHVVDARILKIAAPLATLTPRRHGDVSSSLLRSITRAPWRNSIKSSGIRRAASR